MEGGFESSWRFGRLGRCFPGRTGKWYGDEHGPIVESYKSYLRRRGSPVSGTLEVDEEEEGLHQRLSLVVLANPLKKVQAAQCAPQINEQAGYLVHPPRPPVCLTQRAEGIQLGCPIAVPAVHSSRSRSYSITDPSAIGRHVAGVADHQLQR